MIEAAATPDAPSRPVTIKKYANRRLYNTATSSYVTLEHLCQMVKQGTDFVVYDAKTGEDITRSVLTQIIVEEEAKGGQNLLPISFLRQLIGFYGDSLGGLVPGYLEFSMQSFARNEERMRDSMKQALDGLFPFAPFEEMGKQNMALFDSAMKMFTPFYNQAGYNQAAGAPPSAGVTAETPAPTPSAPSELGSLEARLAAMQQQLDKLSRTKKDE
jgi:polyhydroxyalkanoate synthesis repressor PhaR